MSDISNLRPTILPKSDQLNAEQMLSGPLTITISEVRVGSDEQPVALHHDLDPKRPYKPCKTMRKVLIFAWGEDGRNWPGRSMTLYNDPNVMFGGMKVGGIRISHLSDIEGDINLSLTATKGKKSAYTIQKMERPKSVGLGEVVRAISEATNKEGMDKAKSLAQQLTNPADIEAAKTAYAERLAALKPSKPKDEPALMSYAQLADMMNKATTEDTRNQILDLARHLPADQQQELAKLAGLEA